MGKRILTALGVPHMKRGYQDKEIPAEYLWNYAIGKIFLDPYNLNGKIFTLNISTADKIKYQTGLDSVISRRNSGFWLCNMTVLNEDTFTDGFIQCQSTPIYTGISNSIGKFPNVIGNIFVDSYTFGCDNPMNKSLLKKFEEREHINVDLTIDSDYIMVYLH